MAWQAFVFATAAHTRKQNTQQAADYEVAETTCESKGNLKCGWPKTWATLNVFRSGQGRLLAFCDSFEFGLAIWAHGVLLSHRSACGRTVLSVSTNCNREQSATICKCAEVARYSACSVAASYKPPCRVGLPACAHLLGIHMLTANE